MKILLVSLEYPPQIGGVANYYYNLKTHWPEPENFIVLDNSEGKLLAKRRFLPWLKSIKSIYRSYRKNDSDLVLIGQVLPLGTSAALLSIFFPFRFAVFLHGLDYSLANATPLKKVLCRFILTRASVIVCANSEVRRLLINSQKNLIKKIELLNPGAKVEEAKFFVKEELKEKYQLNNKKIIFSLGRLVRRKGFDRVIQSLDKVELDNFIYVICGQGKEKKYLRELADRSIHRKKIIFIDNINNDEKWAWLSLCDIFIMPARNIAGDFEGFGIVYLEANLMSKPVIAGASGGVADAVKDGVNGLLINPEDNNAISGAINTLLKNPKLAHEMGECGRKRAKADFNWINLAQSLATRLNEKL